MTQKTNPWTFDVRVRERNLKAGSLTEKDVEKYLTSLPDNADQAEAFATAQLALEQPEIEEDADKEDGGTITIHSGQGTGWWIRAGGRSGRQGRSNTCLAHPRHVGQDERRSGRWCVRSAAGRRRSL